MKILLAEDDPQLGDALQIGLRLQGFQVNWVRDGFAARHELGQTEYAMAVLDIAMPRATGLEVLRDLRERKNKIPVLMLTARDASRDITDALDAGADDYVIKPVDLTVLAARLRALSRRAEGGATQSIIKLGNICINSVKREVRVADEAVNLSGREFDLLNALVLANGRVLTRDHLEQQLYAWGQEVESNTIEVHIHNLRKKIGKETINTVRGIGYQIKHG
jgi:DNA-binding response OmpR family regulator